MKTLDQAIAEVEKRDKRSKIFYIIAGIIIALLLALTFSLNHKLSRSNERLERTKDSLQIIDNQTIGYVSMIDTIYDSIGEMKLNNTRLTRSLDNIGLYFDSIARLRQLPLDTLLKLDSWKIKANELGLNFEKDRDFRVVFLFDKKNASEELKLLNAVEEDTLIRANPVYLDNRNRTLYYYDDGLKSKADSLANRIRNIIDLKVERGSDRNLAKEHRSSTFEIYITGD